MKKKIWMINHYATGMHRSKGGRHYWFAENLLKKDYEPLIICANSYHNSREFENTLNMKFCVQIVDNIPFVFVKTSIALGNGIDRVKNMLLFYLNLFPVTKQLVKEFGKPDVILASSVHPLTMIAGIKIAKKLKIPCICEVRDLWPESLIAYGILRKGSFLSKILYLGEKWIYKRADAIVMTWEGGKQYLIDKNWEKEVNLKKVYHISNGVDIEKFTQNIIQNEYFDIDIDCKSTFKIVYTGSIRRVNNISFLLDVAKIFLDNKKIKFLIFGSGDELDTLKLKVNNENINNVVFKGNVDKKYIPSILSKSDINFLHNSSTILDKYGQSQNKLFEYLAAGKCIIQTYCNNYNIINKFNCGIVCEEQTINSAVKSINYLFNDKETCYLYGVNAKKAAMLFDYKLLSRQYDLIIQKILNK